MAGKRLYYNERRVKAFLIKKFGGMFGKRRKEITVKVGLPFKHGEVVGGLIYTPYAIMATGLPKNNLKEVILSYQGRTIVVPIRAYNCERGVDLHISERAASLLLPESTIFKCTMYY